MTGTRLVGNQAAHAAGGIFNAGGAVTLNISEIKDGGAGYVGGAILNTDGGTVTLKHSTIHNNRGGGLYNDGTMVLAHSVVGGNQAGDNGYGGGIEQQGGTLSLTNALEPGDLTGDPGLGAFIDNGTPGRGHFPLLPASSAIDAGDDSVCPPTDQLGRPRPQDGDGDGTPVCDIGSVERPPEVVLGTGN